MENRDRYNNLFLIGFSGSGKSSVGKLLARKLKFNFLDTDKKIEANLNMKISEIITRRGENYFRKIETECLNEINYDSKIVISTGGGIPTIKENLKIMNHYGIMIWLNSTIKTIIKRLEESKEIRPLLGEKINENELSSLYEQREKYYQLAKFSIKTDNKSLNTLAEEIKNKLCEIKTWFYENLMKNKYLASEVNTSQGNYRVIVGKSILNLLGRELEYAGIEKKKCFSMVLFI